jgi:AcrR family transcriptional regulator
MQRRKTSSAKVRSARERERPARERLLAVASDLFYRRGIRSVGIDEIIAAADVAKMSLYRSFPSKDELAAAYLRELDRDYWRRWEAAVARHPGSPRDQLKELFRTLERWTTRPDWRGCPFTNAATEFPEPDHPARRVAEANKRELRRRLRQLVRAAGARDSQVLADQLMLLFEGAYTSPLTCGSRGPASAVADAAEAVIARHLDGR